ncbi:MAG TPA: diphosphate--fructose-6-phosphate 1-phosphotransferase [Elusimicrobia bacterium]|nr:MAG: diphosphate--fructose-6-phosphate 1-phosphotransferase [Elusimicrobia bacterium RIFOXYA12_FULL_49_49]OGS11919.1 MAG: diphosphate--fructose-6-phosphate 1-phosphotransferase [Elusimicrobia bacterium RIFOXYB1_FULL_48_9]OGS14930.1 MAG: diphosphate--fructose-6-phosphate 1-phosphotransferase [Elusimicrobia bacterium RIFOXYA2_FULL_47_53]OGS26135.1 MAG: diphosphate--fructose-6-phosphate 1-phosphotransferase [Elusimicrobia bacterium RIFOXYB12_FULL_50_12]OGS29275.1 MAG: diphosphate--fructose-6-ph
MAKNMSELQAERAKFKPVLPAILKNGAGAVVARQGKRTESISDQETVNKLFENTYGLPVVTFAKGKNPSAVKKAVKIGVVLSGGQAPGGHNVIAGLFDGLKKANPKNKLIGFLGGPSGILDNKWKEITAPYMDHYRNTGGFDIIQSGRTKIETPEQFEQAKNNILDNKIDALVVVGGDDSNTNAALLAEYFKKEGTGISVVGVPKTIDGDLKNEQIESSFGFDTATKIYSELVGNICRDVNSARKYWHFVRLMGRSASHITLEVGFKTQPNITLIGEEILAKKMTLSSVVDNIVGVIAERAELGKNFGVALVPEGLIEFIPEMKELISALNDAMADNEEKLNEMGSVGDKKNFVCGLLPENLASLLKSLPSAIAAQLMLDRDPHGNVQVSQIETEKLLIEMVKVKLRDLKKAGLFKGKFSAITHFFGYEGRCGAPSNFDANYTYALGYNAAVLALNGLTGYISSVRKLLKKSSDWVCGGVPLTMMMNIERRKGKEKPVIQKALVRLDGAPFKTLLQNRDNWALTESYIFPGPIQYFGPSAVTDMTTKTLAYEQKGK